MFYTLVISGIVLFIVLMALVYRVFTLVNIAKSADEDADSPKLKVGSANSLNALLFIVFFFVGGGLIAYSSMSSVESFLPEAASEHGGSIDWLFWLTTAVVFFVFIIVHALLFFFPYMYRYKETRKAYYYPDNHKLELVWTVVPAIVLTGLVISGWYVWSDVTAPAPEESLQIEIVGKQYNWMVRYGGKDRKIGDYDYLQIDGTNAFGMDFKNDFETNADDFVAPFLRLPKDENVLLKIRSRDVLHSVFLPHFRVKMDAVPGMPTQFWFKPIYTTEEMREKMRQEGDPRADKFEYHLACTEICGNSHFAMQMKVVVDTKEDFYKWYNEQKSWAVTNKDYLKEKGVDTGKLAVLAEK